MDKMVLSVCCQNIPGCSFIEFSNYAGVNQMSEYREILRLCALKLNRDSIASSCHVSSKTIAKTKKRAAELGLSWPLPDWMTEEKLAEIMFPRKSGYVSNWRHPDIDRISRRLMSGGISRKALWEEYVDECRRENARPLMYSWFCRCIRQNLTKQLGVRRHPAHGIRIETAWSQNAVSIKEQGTGRVRQASIFVAAMAVSGYAYAEASTDIKAADQIRANVHMLGFMGGAPKMIVQYDVPYRRSNLSTDREFRRGFREFSEHYGTAVVPQRARIRMDLPGAGEDGAVSPAGQAAAWLVSELKGESFSTIEVLNLRLREKISEYNSLPDSEKEKSRERVFQENELPLLSALPAEPYEYVVWRKARVQLNGYVTFEYMRYSAPIENAGKDAWVRVTDAGIEIFVDGKSVAAHKRLYGRKGKYSTVYRHLYREKNRDRSFTEDADELRRWAKEIGPFTEKMAVSILETPQTSKVTPATHCRLFLGLSKVFTPEKLEEACRDAFAVSCSPDYTTVSNILLSRDFIRYGK